MSMTAKTIREHIARSRAAAQKGELLRCLASLRDAVGGVLTRQVFGREKFEIDVLLVEALRDLNKNKTLRRVLPKGVSLVRGQEKRLFVTVSRLHDKLKEAIERAKIERLRKKYGNLDDLLMGAQEKMKADEPLEARRLFRVAADTHTDVPGLLSDIGTRMMMGGLVSEALEYLTRAIEMDPRDQRAHSSTILCCEGLGKLPEADAAIRAAMRHLGASESLYLKLGKVALARRDWGTALSAAEAVLKQNPLSPEARKIARKAKPRVYGKLKNIQDPRKKPETADGTKPKRDSIKLDM